MIYRLTFALLSSITPLLSPAQNKIWTLDQCIAQASENNLEINQNRLSSEQRLITFRQAKASLLPTASIGASHNYQFGRSVDPSTNRFEQQNYRTNFFSVSSSLTLFKGFQTVRNIERNNLAWKASLYEVESTKYEIAMSVVAAYMQLLLNYELVEIAKLQIDASQSQLQGVSRLVEAGSLPEINSLQIAAQLSLETLTLTDAENDLQMAKINLMQLMELPVDDNFTVEKPLLYDPNSTQQLAESTIEIYKSALAWQPQIQSTEYNKRSAASAIRATQGARLPQLTLNTSIFTFYSSLNMRYQPGASMPSEYPFYSQLNDQIGEQVSLNLYIPILSNRSLTSNIERAKIDYKMAEIKENQIKNQLRKDIEQANANIKSAAKRVESAKNAMTSSEKSYRNSEKRLNAGLLNSADFIIQKNNYSITQSKYIQAKYNYHFRSKVFDFYMAKDKNIF